MAAAHYPVNDTSLSEGERGYLQGLLDTQATQDLGQDLRPEVRSLTVVFTILATAVVGLRFFARHKAQAAYLIDDWLILVALAFLFANMIFNLVLIDIGLGLHSGRLTLEALQHLNKTLIGAEVVYVTGVTMYKISLLYLYSRIFPLPDVRRWGRVCGAVTTTWSTACTIAACVQCVPLNKLWEPWQGGVCINLFVTQLCISVPSIICDVAILCLPLPHVWKLKTNLTQKIFLVGIFMLGSYVVFASIYRFVIYLDYRTADIPYTLAVPCAWNVIEISSGIVSACLPTLGPVVRPLVKSVMPSSLGMSKTPKSGENNLENAGSGVVEGGSAGLRSVNSKWRRTNDSKARTVVTEGQYGTTANIELQKSTMKTTAQALLDADDSMKKGGGKSSAGSNGSHVRTRSKTSGSDEFPLTGPATGRRDVSSRSGHMHAREMSTDRREDTPSPLPRKLDPWGSSPDLPEAPPAIKKKDRRRAGYVPGL